MKEIKALDKKAIPENKECRPQRVKEHCLVASDLHQRTQRLFWEIGCK